MVDAHGPNGEKTFISKTVSIGAEELCFSSEVLAAAEKVDYEHDQALQDAGSSSDEDGPSSADVRPRKARASSNLQGMAIQAARAFQQVVDKELEYEASKTYSMIHPDKTFRLTWDMVGLVAIMYQAVTVPFELAFADDGPSGEVCLYNTIAGYDAGEGDCAWAALNLLVDCFFAVDILINFVTGFYDKGALVMVPRRCASSYVGSWFFIDFLGIFPWRYIQDDSGDESESSGASESAKLLRLVKFLKFVRLLKLLRVMKLRMLLVKLEDHLRSEYLYVVFQLIKLSMSLLLLCHITACAWHAVGMLSIDMRPEDDEDHTSWLENTGLHLDWATNAERYIAALYFTMATMTTVGYGDISAGNFPLERAFGTLTLLGGTGVFAVLISSINTLLDTAANAAPGKPTGADSNRQALRYLWKTGVSGELTVQLRKYLQQRNEANEELAIECYLRENLSRTLLHEYCVECFHSTVVKFDFFRDLSLALVADVCCICNSVRCCPAEVLFAEGDSADAMYFIYTGRVLVMKSERDDDDRIPELASGMHFGEACLFHDNAHRQASIVCRCFCVLVRVGKAEFEGLTAWNDELHEHVRSRRQQTERHIKRISTYVGNHALADQSRLSSQCSVCRAMGHYPDECPVKLMFENAKEEFIIGESKPEYRPIWLRIFIKLSLKGRCCPKRLRRAQARYRRRRRRLQIFGLKDGADDYSSEESNAGETNAESPVGSEKSYEEMCTKNLKATRELSTASKQRSQAGKSSISSRLSNLRNPHQKGPSAISATSTYSASSLPSYLTDNTSDSIESI